MKIKKFYKFGKKILEKTKKKHYGVPGPGFPGR